MHGEESYLLLVNSTLISLTLLLLTPSRVHVFTVCVSERLQMCVCLCFHVDKGEFSCSDISRLSPLLTLDSQATPGGKNGQAKTAWGAFLWTFWYGTGRDRTGDKQSREDQERSLARFALSVL